MTRSDKKAVEVMKRGALRFEKLRFVTLTGCTDFRTQFRKLKSWFKEQMKQFEYFGVRTNEGAGVVHFVYAGKSVKYGELSKAWAEISGFWNVSISLVRNTGGIMQEIARQHKKVRYFYSRSWLPRSSNQIQLVC